MPSTTVTTDAPYPPKGTQLKIAAGTLTGVVCAQPIVSNPTLGGPPTVTSMTGSTPLDVSFYDTNSGVTTGNPIATVKSDKGYAPTSLNVTFSTGLYVVQRSPSAVQVTFS